VVISTHILDTELGRPATGVAVSLYSGDRLVSNGQTDMDGRIRDLSEGQSLGPGEYRLVFEVRRPFFRRVEVAIAVDDSEAHYHVPLLLSPYACVIYRGS
jgi:5-hydroxyisourate hydrolase